MTPSTPASTLEPTIVLGVQAVIAAVAAAAIAKWLGNEQGRVVAWTAFVVIAASAGESTRRAGARLVATVLGAICGVVVAASIPHNTVVLVAAVAVG